MKPGRGTAGHCCVLNKAYTRTCDDPEPNRGTAVNGCLYNRAYTMTCGEVLNDYKSDTSTSWSHVPLETQQQRGIKTSSTMLKYLPQKGDSCFYRYSHNVIVTDLNQLFFLSCHLLCSWKSITTRNLKFARKIPNLQITYFSRIGGY